jgi:hypothetical protein
MTYVIMCFVLAGCVSGAPKNSVDLVLRYDTGKIERYQYSSMQECKDRIKELKDPYVRAGLPFVPIRVTCE